MRKREGTGIGLVRRVAAPMFGALVTVFLLCPGAAHAAPPPPADVIADDTIDETIDVVTDDIVDDTEVFDVLDLDGFVFKNAELPEPVADEVVFEPGDSAEELPATGAPVGAMIVVATTLSLVGLILRRSSQRLGRVVVSRRASSC